MEFQLATDEEFQLIPDVDRFEKEEVNDDTEPT